MKGCGACRLGPSPAAGPPVHSQPPGTCAPGRLLQARPWLCVLLAPSAWCSASSCPWVGGHVGVCVGPAAGGRGARRYDLRRYVPCARTSGLGCSLGGPGSVLWPRWPQRHTWCPSPASGLGMKARVPLSPWSLSGGPCAATPTQHHALPGLGAVPTALLPLDPTRSPAQPGAHGRLWAPRPHRPHQRPRPVTLLLRASGPGAPSRPTGPPGVSRELYTGSAVGNGTAHREGA